MINRKSVITGAISISIAATLWGLDGVVLTPRLSNLNIGFVVFVFHALPFLIMNAFLYKQYRHIKEFTKGDVLVLFLVALLGGAVGTMSIVKALFLVNFKELSIVVLLQKLQPVFAIALASILLKERVNKYFLLWGSLAIFGGYFLTFGFAAPHLNTGSKTVISALYALLAAFSFGSSTVFSKMVLNRYNFATATFYRYGLTALIMFVYVIVSGTIIEYQKITSANWLIFFIIAFTTGSGAIFLYYHGLTRVKAIVAIICELFFPMSTIFFDWAFNGNKLTVIQWISALIMIFAIINLNRTQAITVQDT
jgi:drug/metabolite transporter (DMT)-like permease